MTRPGRRIVVSAVLATVVLACLASTPAYANRSSCSVDPTPAASPRIVHTSLDGLGLNVLLPSGYAGTARRYPVLYLLHGAGYNENTWLDETNLASFTAGFSGSRAAIVVMPDGGPMGWYRNWADGSEQWERYHLSRLVPYIDSHFRTRSDRAHRAIAGFSLGGLGAMDYAARHPNLFVAGGDFSGLTDLTLPDPAYTGAPPTNPRTGAGSPGPAYGGRPRVPYVSPDDQGSGCGRQGSAFGNRVNDALDWHNHNPTDLASNLRGLGALYVASGNGVPCGPKDVTGPPSFAGPGFEPVVRRMNRRFNRVLTQARVSHTTDFYSCGIHTMRYAQRDLHHFWPLMVHAFGTKRPARFSYRTADRDFHVWGWRLDADPNRAPEFLELRDASDHGLTLTGSGTETVVTPPLFTSGQQVAVKGALPRLARANPSGRLKLRVDLGPPDSGRQFSPDGSKPHFVTRVVRLSSG